MTDNASATALAQPETTADATNANVGKPRSLWADAISDLIRNPMFIISAIMILFLAVVAIFPGLFTSTDPQAQDILKSRADPEPGHPMGYDLQGHDIYARVIYGARASITIGLLVTAGVLVIGGTVGAAAGYFGGWIDAILSRIMDVFFALPLVLAGIVVLSLFEGSLPNVTYMLIAFGWPPIARIMRGSVIQAKQSDYVTAARSLGASTVRIIVRHIIPNAIAPVIVIATISLGLFIVAEATLSYLGIGLNPEQTVSWGGDINQAQRSLRTNPEIMMWPSLALSVCVLSFMLLGDAVRDALDPKLR